MPKSKAVIKNELGKLGVKVTLNAIGVAATQLGYDGAISYYPDDQAANIMDRLQVSVGKAQAPKQVDTAEYDRAQQDVTAGLSIAVSTVTGETEQVLDGLARLAEDQSDLISDAIVEFPLTVMQLTAQKVAQKRAARRTASSLTAVFAGYCDNNYLLPS